MNAPIVINPDKAGHARVTQSIINDYYNYIKDIKTTWVKVRDDEGKIIAIVPHWHILFKDGSDWEMELNDDGSRNRVTN
jgi:hypothetical protein